MKTIKIIICLVMLITYPLTAIEVNAVEKVGIRVVNEESLLSDPETIDKQEDLVLYTSEEETTEVAEEEPKADPEVEPAPIVEEKIPEAVPDVIPDVEPEAVPEATVPETVSTVDEPDPEPIPTPEPIPDPEPAETSTAGVESYDLLSRLVEAEAQGESYAGKVAVAEVILNRVASGQFPNSIEGVILESGQFSPISDGRINNTASQSSKDAVQEAIAGSNTVGGALFFYNPAVTGYVEWFAVKQTTAVIGNHEFKL